MKIALFTDSYYPEINGLSVSVMTLRNELIKNNHEVLIVTTNDQINNITLENHVLRIPGRVLKKLYDYKMTNIYSKLAFQEIKSYNFDIIHAHSEFGIGIFAKIIAKIMLNIPLVYTYHTMYEDYTYYITKGYFENTAKDLVKKVSKLYCHTSNEIIAPSFKTKIALQNYGVKKYINVVPSGIELDKFKKENINFNIVNQLKKELNLENCKVILTLGRIAKEKSIDVIIEGFSHFKKINKSNVKLLIVGGGPDLDNLKNKVAELKLTDSIIFTGKIPFVNIPLYYHIADIFVSASITETQGLTFIEALTSSLPVLARYDRNLKEILQDGETGYFFTSIQDFANKASLLLNLDNESMDYIKQSINKNINQFSSETFYNKIIEVYKRAIRNSW